jgi:hypothetical protein
VRSRQVCIEWLLQTFKCYSRPASAATVAQGQLMSSTSPENTVRLCDAATPVSAVTFSLDGQLLESVPHDNTVSLFGADIWSAVSAVSIVAFSPDAS